MCTYSLVSGHLGPLKDELCEVNKVAIVVKPGSNRGHSVKSSAMILDDTGEK